MTTEELIEAAAQPALHQARGAKTRRLRRLPHPSLLLPLILVVLGGLGIAAGQIEEPLNLNLAPCATAGPEPESTESPTPQEADLGPSGAGAEVGSSGQLTIVVFDLSSSVISGNGADPRGRSFEEAVAVTESMAAQTCSPDDRVGAVFFANQSVEVPAVLVSSYSIIEATFIRPPTSEIGGGTVLTPALRRAREMIARHPDLSPTVILFSDMRLEVGAEVEAIAELDSIGRDLLHLVALGDYDPSYDGYFETVLELENVRRGDAAASLINAINHSRRETR